MNSTVGNGGEGFVVGNDDKRLSKLVTQIKKQLVQVFLVACV